MAVLSDAMLNSCIKNVLLIYKQEALGVCLKVEKIISSFGLKPVRKVRDIINDNDFKTEKLVVIVGGDGTSLKVSQHIRNNCILFGVNDAPKTTEGAFTHSNINDFKDKFSRLLHKKAKIINLPRLQASINGKVLPSLALNEVSISREKPYLALMHENSGGYAKSSGIIVSTPIGSTAWCMAAGGKKMPLSSKKIQYVVREPYHGRIYKAKKRAGLVDKFKVRVFSKGVITFDSIRKEYSFVEGDIIAVEKAKKGIFFVDFNMR